MKGAAYIDRLGAALLQARQWMREVEEDSWVDAQVTRALRLAFRNKSPSHGAMEALGSALASTMSVMHEYGYDGPIHDEAEFVLDSILAEVGVYDEGTEEVVWEFPNGAWIYAERLEALTKRGLLRLPGRWHDNDAGWTGLRTPTFSCAVLEAIRAGRKLDAIKLHRARTGTDLKEAKAAIDDAIARGA